MINFLYLNVFSIKLQQENKEAPKEGSEKPASEDKNRMEDVD